MSQKELKIIIKKTNKVFHWFFRIRNLRHGFKQLHDSCSSYSTLLEVGRIRKCVLSLRRSQLQRLGCTDNLRRKFLKMYYKLL